MDLLLVLWPKQVINISGTSTVLLGLFLLILKPVLRKIESTPALLNQVIVILRALSICQNLAELDQSVSKRNGLFLEGLLKNHLLRAYYLGFD